MGLVVCLAAPGRLPGRAGRPFRPDERHLGGDGCAGTADAAAGVRGTGQGRTSFYGHFLHYLARRREPQPARSLYGRDQDPGRGPVGPAGCVSSALEIRILPLGRAGGRLFPESGHLAHAPGPVHAAGCRHRRPHPGRHQRRLLLGRMGTAVLHDGEDAGGRQPYAAVCLLVFQQQSGESGDPALRAVLQDGEIQGPVVPLGWKTLAPV